MFAKVLVANRGEIALRVLRACKELRLPTVAVYSEADRDGPWLSAADEAYLLGPAPASESYLHVDRLIEVAERASCDALHPGYGFLAESPALAEACERAGIAWIGPPSRVIARMGDKLSARAAAVEAGMPVVPGTTEPVRDAETVRAFAAEHGFPVALKAAYGGGGKGLRVVESDDEVADALDAARRESAAAFGRDEIYAERYLRRPRHVEAQILADAHGNVVFCGDRDCSTQRRHQKLIEEAPAPGLRAEERAELAAASTAVGRAVGYVGAGTVECLYEDGDFYFLEMNTRLQVEHPVTEMVSGQDLVHWQIRVAAGEELCVGAGDFAPRGHAIEVRVNAEDPAAAFVPAPGLVTRWSQPSGPGVRVDGGAATGWEVPAAYDSLLAKVVAHGADREQARGRLLRALDELVVEGVPTTVPFHRFALEHPDFVEADVSTISVEQEWDLSALPGAAPPEPGAGAAGPSRSMLVEVDGQRLEVELFDANGGGPAQASGGAPGLSAALGRRAASAGSDEDGPDVKAPMQGTVVEASCAVGDLVAAGDVVAIVEAMKMERPVKAHRDGTVSAVHVGAGEAVRMGDPLVTIAQG